MFGVLWRYTDQPDGAIGKEEDEANGWLSGIVMPAAYPLYFLTDNAEEYYQAVCGQGKPGDEAATQCRQPIVGTGPLFMAVFLDNRPDVR